jgi:hypothetical protein
VVEFIDDEHADAALVRVLVGWSTYLVVLDSTYDLQYAARLSDSSSGKYVSIAAHARESTGGFGLGSCIRGGNRNFRSQLGRGSQCIYQVSVAHLPE